MTEKQLERIRRKLPRKARIRISKKTGLSYSAVCKVLRGEFNNDEIIDEAVREAALYQNRVKNRAI